MMKYLILLFIFFSISYSPLIAQKRAKNKIIKALNKDETFSDLQKNKANIEGAKIQNAGVVYDFLRFCSRQPECITVELLNELEKEYINIVNEYNSFIDLIIIEVNGIQRIKDIKRIDLEKHKESATVIIEKIKTFEKKLNSTLKQVNEECTRQPVNPAYAKVFVEIGLTVVDFFTEKKREKLKAFLILELEKLKLTKIDWTKVKSVVQIGASKMVFPEDESIVNINKANYVKQLKLKNKYCFEKTEITESAQKIILKYSQLSDDEDLDIRELFTSKINETKKAQEYLLSNSVCSISLHEKVKNKATNDNGNQCEELIIQLKTIIKTAESINMSSEDLLKSIKVIIDDS